MIKRRDINNRWKEEKSKKTLKVVRKYNLAMHRWIYRGNKSMNNNKITIRQITRITKNNRLSNNKNNSKKITNNKKITKNNPHTSLPSCSLLINNRSKILMNSNKNRKWIQGNNNSTFSNSKNNKHNKRCNNKNKVKIIEKNLNKNRINKNKMEDMYLCSLIE